MSKTQNKEYKVGMQIKAVDVLKSSLQLPAADKLSTAFNFQISIESRVDAPNKLAVVIVHVEVKNEDQTFVLGTLSVSCVFEIVNFGEVIVVEPSGKFEIPKQLLDTLISISISTSRGVMLSTFKGTFLHHAVLPLIDPSQFN